VLRLKVGGAVTVIDGAGSEHEGVISAIDRHQAVVEIKGSRHACSRRVKLAIACAVPKGVRMDDLIDQLTQLGVASIIPMMTARVVVRLDAAKKEARLKRWRTIAQNAALQSQRSVLPVIGPVTEFADVIARSRDYDLKLIPHLEGEKKLIKDVLAGRAPRNIIVLIGPEGDFTAEEVQTALEAGFLPVSLGDTVLRVSTAAAAVAGYIKFTLGD
jgi:16S rRNA (uracil1498-N3)-methyltransferase